eukprot:PITA_29906
MEKFFDYEETEDEKKVNFVVTKIKGHATLWWDGVQVERKSLGKQSIKNWNRMVAKLRGKFLPSNYQQTLFRQMHNLRQRSMTVREYRKEFYKVSIRDGKTRDIDEKVARYVNGLRMDLQDEISIMSPKIVEEAYKMVLKLKKNSSSVPEEEVIFEEKEVKVNAGISQRNAIVAQVEEEEATMIEEEDVSERGEFLVVNKVFLKPTKEIVEPSQRKTLFRTVCKVQGKCWQMIIDSGSTNNLVSTEVVEKLKLKRMRHPTPYKVSWLQKGHQLFVNEKCEVEL